MAWPWKPIMGGLFSTPAAGIYGATSMAQNQGNAMMGNYNLANQSGLDLSNYMTLDGTKPVVNQGQLLADTQNRMPPMLDQTGQMGASNYRGPQGTTFDPAQGNIPYAPQEKRGFFSNLKNKLSGFTTPGMALMKRMVEPNTPEENFGLEYFKNMRNPTTGRVWEQWAPENVFGGGNIASAFGGGMGERGQKRIDTINATLAKWEADKEKYADQLRNTTLYRRRDLFKKQLDAYNKDLAGTTGGAEITTTKPGTPIAEGYTGTRDFDPGQAAAATPSGHYERTAGPTSGSGYGPWKAEGGRVGYRDGEFVDEDINIQGPGFDVNENIEMASGEGEEGILRQLYAKYIEAGFPPDQAEAMALQELEQMAAGPEQDQGIASLV